MSARFARLALLALLWLGALTSFAQVYHHYGFVRSQNVAVQNQNGQPLSLSWSGGMNSVRFAPLDLNNDGVGDLVAFEKHGNRILPFVRTGTNDSSQYVFAPQYVASFPTLHDWTIFKDYDGDGLADIFTYGLAGISVYRNVSDASGLHFSLVAERLASFYYQDSSNLYTSPDDYLVIEDLDGDGDLDILNFWILGKYVHYHRNYSMELYGDAAHFAFRLEDECWGHFEEGGEDNSIVLNSGCGSRKEPLRHVGSTLFARDLTGNGLPDLVLGDIDFPNLILLRNEGSLEDARIVAIDTLFPNPDQPVWLYSMPAINFIDLDGDGDDEILASPSDPSLTKSQDHHSVWIYHFNPETIGYERLADDFLQGEMVDVGSGAHPVFYDWDGDGLTDLFVSNYGAYDSSNLVNGFLTSYYSASISYYLNVGTPQEPVFRLQTSDFGQLKQLNLRALHPAFGDCDGDGVADMLCGVEDGSVLLFKNHSTQYAPPVFDAPVPLQNVEVQAFATPQLFDLDRDGRPDLLVGNRRGRIAYYRNVSDGPLPDFEWMSDTLGGVDVRDAEVSFFGHSVPFFFRTSTGETRLFCGSEQGNVYYYNQIDGNLSGRFHLEECISVQEIDSQVHVLREGTRSAPVLCDWNGDGYPDMAVGNYAGGLTAFEGTAPLPVNCPLYIYGADCFNLYPNPATSECHLQAVGGSCGRAVLTILDAKGAVLLARTIENLEENDFVLNVSDFVSGIYFVSLQSPSGCQIKKLVVAH